MNDAVNTDPEFELARVERQRLRRELRARRRALPSRQRAAASRQMTINVRSAIRLHPGQRVALYSPLAGEIDIAGVLVLARRHSVRVYLPRITDRRRGRMRFVEATGAMRRNRLGILEPTSTRAIGARWLDVAFVPLVGFDPSGARLGMGAGYYDRAFAYRRLRRAWHKPRLVGIGYAMQRVPRLLAQPHDVRLDAIVTEEGVLECATGC